VSRSRVIKVFNRAGQIRPGKRFLVGFVSLLLCAQMGLLQLASVSPEVHACLHAGCAPNPTSPKNPDGDQTPPEAHVCAVTLLQQGITLEVASAVRIPESTVVHELGQSTETHPGSLIRPTTRARAPPCI
jgi:hypothetical protein